MSESQADAFSSVPPPLIDGVGRLLIALPMLVYPVLHFIYTDFVASIIPPWIPWHLFWTYFTALTIFAAGLAILFKKVAQLAAALLAVEILLFCLLIHLPLLFHSPANEWAHRQMFGDMPSRVNNAFKDFGLSGAVFLFAGAQSGRWRVSGRDSLSTFGLAIVSISIVGFAIVHFVNPAFAPGIPPMEVSIGFPLPAHLFWVYLSAIALLVLTIGLWVRSTSARAALILAVTILFFELLTWIPDFVAHPGGLVGNWLKDLGIIGGLMISYSALTEYRATPGEAPSSDRFRSHDAPVNDSRTEVQSRRMAVT